MKLLVLLLSLSVFAETRVHIDSTRWFKVYNSKASCLIQAPAYLVEKFVEGNKVVMETFMYRKGKGGNCENGTEVVMPSHHQDTLKAESKTYLAHIQKTASILNGHTPKSHKNLFVGDVVAYKEWQWAVMENFEMKTERKQYYQRDVCRITAGSPIEIRGFDVEKDKVLLEYVIQRNEGVRECPHGTLFYKKL